MRFLKRFLTRFKQKIRIFWNNSEHYFSADLRENEIIGAIANAIASNVGKLSPQVVRKDPRGVTIKNDRLSKLLNIRPCPEASTYDFLYRMASDLVYRSNAFAVVVYNDDFTEITRIQPITVETFDIFTDEDENVLFRFVWAFDKKEYVIPYQFVIHIKARYNKKRFLGTSPDHDLQSSIDLLNTTYQGIKSGIKNSTALRGYLKYNNFIDEEDMKDKVKEFQNAYLNAENGGGLAGLDNSIDFHELKQTTYQIPTDQISFFRDNIYRYYNVSEKILTGTYTETEWNSFYEAVIEPIAIQLSLEFTFKLFTERERGFGNKIIFTANRLQYATLQTRSSIGTQLFDRGIITINEYRELMYLPQIDDGDVRMVSLNYVKAEDQSLYQTGREDGAVESENKALLLKGVEKHETGQRQP